jgi:hypothetical protein
MKLERATGLGLRWLPPDGGTQQPADNGCWQSGGYWRGDATGAERVGGCCLFVPDGGLNNEKIGNKIHRGLRWLPTNKTHTTIN